MSQLWQVPENFKILSQTWGDESVVYHCGSGDTHLLSEISFQILKSTQQSRRSNNQIADYVADALLLELDKDLQDHINESILMLAKLNLIEPVSN